MFFILSKTLSFLLSPLLWIVLILFLGIIAKHRKKKKKLLITALFLLFFFSNSFIFSIIKSTIDTEAIKYENLKKQYEYGIVLGGFSSYDKDFNRLNFHKASDRLWQAILLYKKHKINKFLISGGSGKLFNNKYKEADFVKSYLISIGVPKVDILIENKSKNTFENAINSVEILKQEKNHKYLLVTSSLHTLRAKKCFEKAGLKVDVFPTNYISYKNLNFNDYLIPNSAVLFSWNELIHEITGLAIYKISGKI